MNNDQAPHEHIEFHKGTDSTQLNALRAAVLGSMDGVVSTASLVIGVAATHAPTPFIATAGIAGLLAGALSMAVGEYVSVSTQRDTEHSFLEKEKLELAAHPDKELDELVCAYEEKGLSRETALRVAKELSSHDALSAHAEIEFGVKSEAEFTNPWHAAYASAASFTAGSLVPLVAILTPGPAWRIQITFAAVIVTLVVTGYVSASISKANKRIAVTRVVLGGLFAMAITYGIGHLFGVSGI